MRAKVSVVVIGVAMLLAAASAIAHHSFAAEFDANQPVTLKGTITKMDWVSPHSWLYIDVKDREGKVVTWAVEFGAPNTLIRRGWRKTDLPVGAEVTVEGYRAKSGGPIAYARDVTLPDGRTLFAGTPGSGAP